MSHQPGDLALAHAHLAQPRLQPVYRVVFAVLTLHHLNLPLALARELLAHVGLLLLDLVQRLVV